MRTILTITCIVALVFNLSSCDQSAHVQNNNIRIITLSPHLAELAVSAGAVENLVGVVAYSDFPDEVKNIQLVGDAFKIDYEQIISLNPNFIFSWKGGTPVAVIQKLTSLNFKVIETEIKGLADIPKTISQISKIVKTESIANNNIKLFNQKLEKLRNQNYINQTTFIETYHQPLYTISPSHWISEATSICGYNNVFDELTQKSATIGLESVISKNPQAIINIAMNEDTQWQKWSNLEAVKNDNIIQVSPDYFSRPSMRILKGITQLCENNLTP